MARQKGAQATRRRTPLHSPTHQNNIGLLRLLLATGVIVGHAGYQFEPDAPFKDPLTALIPGTIDLASLCLDGFFILSGWLITMSMLRSSSAADFLGRRILRIYPGYIVAYVVSIWLVYSLYATPAPAQWWRLALLQAAPSFEHGGQLLCANASLWSLAFEFRCYLVIAMLGMTGLLARRELILKITLTLLTLWLLSRYPPLDWRFQSLRYDKSWPLLYAVIGDPAASLRLFTIFFIGASGYLYRDIIEKVVDHRVALLSGIWSLLLLGHPSVAEWAICLVGAPALYWLAFKAKLGRLGRINHQTDISYGTYIYGWPITLSLALTDLSFPAYVAATLIGSWACGWLSWHLIEKRAKDMPSSLSVLKNAMARRRSAQHAAARVRVD